MKRKWRTRVEKILRYDTKVDSLCVCMYKKKGSYKKVKDPQHDCCLHPTLFKLHFEYRSQDTGWKTMDVF